MVCHLFWLHLSTVVEKGSGHFLNEIRCSAIKFRHMLKVKIKLRYNTERDVKLG